MRVVLTWRELMDNSLFWIEKNLQKRQKLNNNSQNSEHLLTKDIIVVPLKRECMYTCCTKHTILCDSNINVSYIVAQRELGGMVCQECC